MYNNTHLIQQADTLSEARDEEKKVRSLESTLAQHILYIYKLCEYKQPNTVDTSTRLLSIVVFCLALSIPRLSSVNSHENAKASFHKFYLIRTRISLMLIYRFERCRIMCVCVCVWFGSAELSFDMDGSDHSLIVMLLLFIAASANHSKRNFWWIFYLFWFFHSLVIGSFPVYSVFHSHFYTAFVRILFVELCVLLVSQRSICAVKRNARTHTHTHTHALTNIPKWKQKSDKRILQKQTRQRKNTFRRPWNNRKIYIFRVVDLEEVDACLYLVFTVPFRPCDCVYVLYSYIK